MCLRLSGHVFRHALVDALVRLLCVLDHQGPIVQQVQAGVRLHAQLIAAETEGHTPSPHHTGNA